MMNGNGEAERFYRALPAPSLIGIEACRNSQWLIELWQRLGHVVWIGDAAQIQCQLCSETKDRSTRCSAHSELLLENRFPRLWSPNAEQRDLRQLLIHRHKLVSLRTQVKGGLQHLALNRGLQKKNKFWSAAGQKALCELQLDPWAACRREDLAVERGADRGRIS